MDNKEIERRIRRSLEDGSETLNPRVLDAVKREIGEQKKVKRRKNALRVAFASIVLVAVCLAVILPLTLKNMPSDEYAKNGFVSMKEYFSEHDIPVKSLGEFLDDGSLAGMGQSDGLEKSECAVIANGNGDDVIVEETYTFIGGDVVTIALLLSDSDAVKEKFYSDYEDLSRNADICGVSVDYDFDDATRSGKAKFYYDGYPFYASFFVQTEAQMLSIIQIFLMIQ